MLGVISTANQKSPSPDEVGVGPWEIRDLSNTLLGGIWCTLSGSKYTETFILDPSVSFPFQDGIKIIKINESFNDLEEFCEYMKNELNVSTCAKKSITYAITSYSTCC